MEYKDQIKINEFVEIEVLNKESEGTPHRTKVLDIIPEKNIVSVAWPTIKGRYLPARKNDTINVTLKTKEGIFFFSSKITARNLEPYAHINMELPDKLIKKQRRAFFRLPLNIVIQFIKIKEMDALEQEYQERTARGEKVDMGKFVPPVYKAVSVDVSGGGMSILSKTPLEFDEELEVTFDLTDRRKYKDLNVKVKRIIELGNKFNYGFEFTNIQNAQREKIISSLFEIQRKRSV